MKNGIIPFLLEYWPYILFHIVSAVLIIWLVITKDESLTKKQKIWYSLLVVFSPFIGAQAYQQESARIERKRIRKYYPQKEK
ncbi:TctA family transporter [Dysgonomonas sp. PH5-45]|uniref:hypothetical protein n=1 Tax=unclassified Dysgonomonas TaxID=2630389 RepID=UPI0024759E58|nr:MULTISPECIES: hypothetical protein [unclassified Dysgonomonas]MDH6355666.1 TctA family transporter [Dysgonomonas sp. PH5-45]MDH6388551.1 TctA family transporter [Dysgonomonas sp. PH5-37]